MVELGVLALRLALIGGVYAVATALWGVLAKRPALVRSGRQAAYAVHAMVLIAALVLWHALLTRDFSDGKATSEMRLTVVRKESVPGSSFEVPAGFTEKKLEFPRASGAAD